MKANRIYLHKLKNNDFANVCKCKFFVSKELGIRVLTEECSRCKENKEIEDDFVTKEPCGCEYIYDNVTDFRYYLKECDKHQ